jgi:hypothetical protein
MDATALRIPELPPATLLSLPTPRDDAEVRRCWRTG